MLTTTYSIVMLNGEQQKARNLVSRLEQYLCNDVGKEEGKELVSLQRAFARLLTAYSYCSERKVELFVIPLVRSFLSVEAHALLANLDACTLYCTRIIEYAHHQIGRAVEGAHIDGETLVSAMRLFCTQATQRLVLEEEELFPLAHRLLSEDDWFNIASQCLSRTEKVPGRYMQPYSARIAARHEKQRFLH